MYAIYEEIICLLILGYKSGKTIEIYMDANTEILQKIRYH